MNKNGPIDIRTPKFHRFGIFEMYPCPIHKSKQTVSYAHLVLNSFHLHLYVCAFFFQEGVETLYHNDVETTVEEMDKLTDELDQLIRSLKVRLTTVPSTTYG